MRRTLGSCFLGTLPVEQVVRFGMLINKVKA